MINAQAGIFQRDRWPNPTIMISFSYKFLTQFDKYEVICSYLPNQAQGLKLLYQAACNNIALDFKSWKTK